MVSARVGAFWLIGALALAPVAADAQPAQGRPHRIGILGPAEEPRFSDLAQGLKQGLRDHGHSEQTIEALEERVARGDRAGARRAVEGLVRQRVKVLFAVGSELARVAREASADLAIVFITPGDPVAAGLVSSLAHPGGNMTGMTFEYPELTGKRLQLLTEIDPRIRRILILHDPRDASPRQHVEAAREAAATLRVKLVEREARTPEDIVRGLDALREADAFLAIPGGMPSSHYDAIVRAANARRLPTMLYSRTRSTAAALASYGASDVEVARQAARLVDKILKGTDAGDLPVERPTVVRLIVNLGTAKALALKIPQPFFLRVDQVIE